MPVVIVGSGRCGTSMVTRMLNLCGLRIGGSYDMFDSANVNNPTGYWEHRAFRSVNTKLLSHFGGNELLPPRMPDNWQYDKALDPIVDEAMRAIQALAASGGNWGWKDPRTSLTLPFWRRLIPDLLVIVCVRNPLAVVRSFEDLLQGYSSIGKHIGASQGYINWYSYNAAIIANTTTNNRVFTNYEEYFPDFLEPLTELLRFACLPDVKPGTAIERRLKSLHDPTLKHHTRTVDELLNSDDVPEFVKDLYVAILKSSQNSIEAEVSLQAAAAQVAVVPELELMEQNPARIQELVYDLILLETRNRRNEAVLSSRTHQLADRICSLLIWREQSVNRFKGAVADKLNDVLAAVDTSGKVRPIRWY